MRRMVCAGMALLALMMTPVAALAANTVLSDVFDGSEPRTDPLPGAFAGDRQLAYQDVGTFEVAADGEYLIKDAYNFDGVDVTALLYSGEFDPQNPLNGLLTPTGIDYAQFLFLSAGVPYRLVVQQYRLNREGAWALAFNGPGNVTSAVSRTLPDVSQGLLSESDPIAGPLCAGTLEPEDGRYTVSGPMQVQVSGTYYYTDILVETGVDVDACLQVYSAPFDANNPDANRVGEAMDDFGSVELESGTDYYFVTQALILSEFSAQTGEYFYVLAPPAPFRITKALAGGWFNPEVDGQGFLLDVYENINFLFMAWYTFDTMRPDASIPSTVGEAGQRWLTAQGPYGQDSANLDLFNAKGMVFNSPSPPVDNQPDGTLDIQFTSCTEGSIDYSITSAGISGTIPIQPLVGPDLDSSTLELCEDLTRQPGMPGPL